MFCNQSKDDDVQNKSNSQFIENHTSVMLALAMLFSCAIVRLLDHAQF